MAAIQTTEFIKSKLVNPANLGFCEQALAEADKGINNPIVASAYRRVAMMIAQAERSFEFVNKTNAVNYTVPNFLKYQLEKFTKVIESDEASYDFVNQFVFVPANLELCERVLAEAEKRKNPYRAKAYRRTAVLLASANFEILNKNTTREQLVQLGLPKHGSTTYFVNQQVENEKFRLNLEQDSSLAYPIKWRNPEHMDNIENNVLILKIVKFAITRKQYFDNDPEGDDLFESPEDERIYYVLYNTCKSKNCEYVFWYYMMMTIRQLELVQKVILNNLTKV